ncbi:ParB N-terminal domain-containing protein [Microbacterium sp. Leaf151]|uniref:ParB N-terminal domain-containing protein n=1 Tax=Microbacterium sp. Leaf151 TaxID=1736276 RepID=UPI0009E7C0D1|nr:ParB N-terminal domain-containing protein [Microbacterium sp. Leaf151]
MSDEIQTISLGNEQPESLKMTQPFKVPPRHEQRMARAVHSSGVVAPIVADQHGNVIDGHTRLRTALKAGWGTVPVMRLETTEAQARLLRFIVNKSAEFQRWNYAEVDAFLAVPHNSFTYLATLEPLGLFGEHIIPESFLTESMRRYKLDGSAGQDKYDQKEVYERWAVRRQEKGARREREKALQPRQRLASYKLEPAVPLQAITARGGFKMRQWEKKAAAKRAIGLTGFVAPLILDQNLHTIDGTTRLEVVNELHAEGWWPSGTVPALVVKRSDLQAAYLRMVLNRTSEFQAWDWHELYEFADAHPQLRPIFEPFGLYGATVLPPTAWDRTALHMGQRAPLPTYTPSTMTLAEWAVIQQKRVAADRASDAVSPMKTAPRSAYESVFDLRWSESDLQPLVDAEGVMQRFVDELDEELGDLTIAHDDMRDRMRVEQDAAKGILDDLPRVKTFDPGF